MIITTFNTVKTTGKIPKSPYNDQTFIFETRDGSLEDIFHSLTERFTLNIPLSKTVRERRQAKPLAPFMYKELTYIIIDLDEVKSETDRQLCLKYFREQKLKVVLGAGRSQYNIKGVMQVETMSIKEAKIILGEIQEALGNKAKVDKSVLNRASFQAPINKYNLLLNQTNHLFNEYKKPKPQKVVIQSIKTDNVIEELCIKLFNEKGFSFNIPTQDGYQCSHPTERKSPNGFSWSREYPFSMSHWNPDRGVSIWADIIKTSEYKQLQKDESENLVRVSMPSIEVTQTNKYLDENEDTVTDFLDNYKMLRIQSPMGSSKSSVIGEVLHQCNKKDLRVLFLTNRISLADDICLKYPGLKHYQGTEIEDTEYKPGDNLVLQIDSFHKFSTKYFDVVILDEFTTTAVKLLSVEKHQHTIVTKFFSLNKKKLVVADAFLFPGLTEMFAKDSECIDIINDYRDPVQLEIFEKKNAFTSDLIETAKKGPITFSSGSTMHLKIVQALADKNELTWASIDAETPKNTREALYNSMRGPKPKKDILMYSPSLTVGVSNENNIETHFHFDTGKSMDVLSSIQMIKRTRKATKIKMFLDERVQYNPVTLAGVQVDLHDYSEQDQDGDEIGITQVGYKLSKIIKLHNILENRHKVSFMELLKFQFTNNITYNKKSKSEINIYNLSKAVKKKERDYQIDVFDEYRKMHPEAINEIDMKLFGTTPREIFIKDFEFHRNDETLKELHIGDEMDNLIKENIDNPGSIEHLKNLIANPLPVGTGTVTKNINKEYSKKGIDIKEYGYKKSGVVWKLNPTLKRIHERIKNEQNNSR